MPIYLGIRLPTFFFYRGKRKKGKLPTQTKKKNLSSFWKETPLKTKTGKKKEKKEKKKKKKRLFALPCPALCPAMPNALSCSLPTTKPPKRQTKRLGMENNQYSAERK